MAIRRVFIFWTHPIFHDAVHVLLNHPEIEQVGASSHYTRDLEKIDSTLADTILVEEIEGSIPVEIMKLLDNRTEIMRIIAINIQDNQMKIYHRVERVVGNAEDLVQWILNDLC